MLKVKKIWVAAAMFATALPLAAQDEVEASLGTDVVTTYVWRGQQNAGVSFQPSASLSWKGLSLGAWGSVAVAPQGRFTGTQEELDLTLAYSTKGLTLGITDYYLFENGAPFFKYGDLGETAHTFEANIGYDFGFLSVNWYTNFAGNDGTNKDGKRAYSSYLQLDAPFKLGKMDWTATLGAVPYYTDFYAADKSSGFHINQVALRAEYPIECGKSFQIPVFGQLVANPSSQGMYFLLGFSIKAL